MPPSRLVDVVVFLREVVAPVFLEVAVGFDSPWLQDRFGAGESPAGGGDVHAVFDRPRRRIGAWFG